MIVCINREFLIALSVNSLRPAIELEFLDSTERLLCLDEQGIGVHQRIAEEHKPRFPVGLHNQAFLHRLDAAPDFLAGLNRVF